MKRLLLSLLLVLFSSSLFCRVVLGDELHLKNGDRITGEVIRMGEGKLTFKTAYAGEISIVWEEVARLTTVKPIKVILSDETVLKGAALPAEKGKMKLDKGAMEKPPSIPLADVQVINPQPKPVVKITARANLGFSTERGNSDTDKLNASGEFIARTEKNRYSMGLEANTERAQGERTVNKWLGYAAYDHFLTEKWFFYAKTLFEHDEFADLDLRSSFGAGVGYQVFETPLLNLSLGAGPTYVNEDFDEAEDNSFLSAGWFISYDQYFFDKLFQLFHRQDGYLSLEDAEDWNIKTRQGLRFPIRNGLYWTLQYNYDYDNTPSENAGKWDSKFLILLGYQFEG